MTLGISLALVAAWLFLVALQAGKSLNLMRVDWMLVLKMLLGYGAAVLTLRRMCALYIPRATPVLSHTPFVPPAR